MRTYYIKTGCDDFTTNWIINAESKKAALIILKQDENFEEDENILSCDRIDVTTQGVVYMESEFI